MPLTLALVRHCRPVVDPAVPPPQWELHPDGHDGALSLARSSLLRGTVVAAAGDEPKMLATMAPLARRNGVELVASSAFGESRGLGWFDDSRFIDVVQAFFDRPRAEPAPGWEPAAHAVDRFRAGIDALVDGAILGGTVAICSGGRVLTALLGDLGILGPDELFPTWKGITMPDIALVEVHGRDGAVLLHPFGGDPAGGPRQGGVPLRLV